MERETELRDGRQHNFRVATEPAFCVAERGTIKSDSGEDHGTVTATAACGKREGMPVGMLPFRPGQFRMRSHGCQKDVSLTLAASGRMLQGVSALLDCRDDHLKRYEGTRWDGVRRGFMTRERVQRTAIGSSRQRRERQSP